MKKIVNLYDISFPVNYKLDVQGCTQSLVCKFRQCPRKFLLSINRWRGKNIQEKTAIGNIVHAVLAITYGGIDNIYDLSYNINEELKINSNKYNLVSTKQMEYFKVVSYCLLTNYLLYYTNDFKTAKFTNTEEEFAVKISDVMWRGKRDGIHIIKKDGSLWVREIKNRSRINEENILSGLQFDFQGNLYCLTKEIETGKKVSGFIYDMIRTPQIKQKQNETLQEFSKRLMEDIQKRPDFYFMRFEVPLSEKDKGGFENEITQLSNNLKEFLSHDLPIIYRNSFSCIDGFIPCEYLEACTSGNMNNYYQTEKIFEELDHGY